MSDYKVVHGAKVQNIAGDPPAPFSGQIWYNDSSNSLKYFFTNLGSWATGGAMNTARATVGGVGTQTAALAFGGRTGPPSADADLTEAYNGSAWTEVNDLNTLRRLPEGAGTSTAALGFGGRGIPPDYPPDAVHAITETWNGTNWTEVNDMNTARRELSGAGSSNTNALAISGRGKEVESWNGTNWTEVGDINNLKNDSGAAGTNTAAIAFGGESPAAGGTNSDNTEIFNAGPTTITFDVS